MYNLSANVDSCSLSIFVLLLLIAPYIPSFLFVRFVFKNRRCGLLVFSVVNTGQLNLPSHYIFRRTYAAAIARNSFKECTLDDRRPE